MQRRWEIVRAEALPRAQSRSLIEKVRRHGDQALDLAQVVPVGNQRRRLCRGRDHAERVLIRDSKDRTGPVLSVPPTEWRAFLATLDQ